LGNPYGNAIIGDILEMGSGFGIDGCFNSGHVVASSSNLTENYPNNSISKPDPISINQPLEKTIYYLPWNMGILKCFTLIALAAPNRNIAG